MGQGQGFSHPGPRRGLENDKCYYQPSPVPKLLHCPIAMISSQKLSQWFSNSSMPSFNLESTLAYSVRSHLRSYSHEEGWAKDSQISEERKVEESDLTSVPSPTQGEWWGY